MRPREYDKGGRFIAVPMAALKISETESGKIDIVLNNTESKST
jgi:hypothetical protein